MEEQNKSRSHAYALLIFASFFLYIVLTGAKNLYVAEKTTLQQLGTFGSFTDLAATMEYYFYAYAVMQILLVFFMHRLNIKYFLTITLVLSAVITILMAFTDTIISHWVLYTVNGAMQAGVWGCSLQVLGKYLPRKELSIANTLMTSGPAVAGVVSYGFAAAFGDNWRLPFIILGILLLFAVGLYFLSVSHVQRFPRVVETHHVIREDGTEEDVSDEDENDFIHLDNKKRKIVFYVLSVVMGLAVTGLFFTINNTLDIFLKQIGGFDNTTAKWITVVAPVAIIIGPILCVKVCDKHRNFLAVGVGFFGLSAVFAVLLLFLFDVHIVLSLVLLLAFMVLTNGGRSISLSIAALKLRDKIDVGVCSVLTNAAASIASGVIPKLFTMIIDKPALSPVENWTNAFMLIAIWNIVVVAVLIGLILWIKYINRNKQ